jgi:ferrochelatase
MNYQAILFISFGGPEKREDVMPFLEIVTRGRGIPRERLEEVAHHYDVIGGASPINAITEAQARSLERELARLGIKLPVYVGQRNWHPFLEETLRKMAEDGIERAVGFTTAAHRSEASLERYVTAVEAARKRVGEKAPAIDYVDPWFDHPLFIKAIAARVEEAIGSERVHFFDAPWYFTAHSIPCAMAKESTYVQELQETAALVSAQHGKKEWRLAYSSRSGRPEDPWLEPDVCDVIREEATRGTRQILFVPIGFVADHVEILFDLDVEAQEAAKEAGVSLVRTKTVGDHPLFIQMIIDVVRKRMESGESAEQRASAATVCQDGRRLQAVTPASTHCYCRPGATDTPCQRTRVAAPAQP